MVGISLSDGIRAGAPPHLLQECPAGLNVQPLGVVPPLNAKVCAAGAHKRARAYKSRRLDLRSPASAAKGRGVTGQMAGLLSAQEQVTEGTSIRAALWAPERPPEASCSSQYCAPFLYHSESFLAGARTEACTRRADSRSGGVRRKRRLPGGYASPRHVVRNVLRIPHSSLCKSLTAAHP